MLGGNESVLETEEFRRVMSVPRRRLPEHDSPEARELVERLTDIFTLKGSTCPGASMPPDELGLCPHPGCRQPRRLRTVQAIALYEAGLCGGLFGPIRVGGGKTLLSLLLPFCANLRRPILLLPAALREKTERNRLALARHWRVARDLRIISYEELGRVQGAELLTFFKPDGILADEAHRLKNKKAAVTRRWKRYIDENPQTKFFCFSGTMLGGGTIKSFAHLAKVALKENAPFPLKDSELDDWADALDEGVAFNRTHPGALLRFASESDDIIPGDDLRTARRAFQRRLLETPGVVSTAGEQVACSLYIRAMMFKPNATTEDNFDRLRGNKAKDYPGWQTPDGWTLSMAAEVSAKARELALGFHQIWNPRPEPEWLAARKEWAAFVRKVLSHSRTYDSELAVTNAIDRNEIPDRAGVLKTWREVKPTFKIVPKDVWHDDTALNLCAEWMKSGPGVVWVKHVFFGEELARRTGAPYFRQEGNNAQGLNLETLADLVREGKQKATPIICSIDACQAGYNLQPWYRNLLTWIPSEAKTVEQLLGRTHRDGQLSDQVEVDILVACIEHYEAWQNALARARMAVDTLGDSQKILICGDVLGMPDETELARMGGPRWRKTSLVVED